MSFPKTLRSALALALVAALPGCMFSMTHQFPPGTQFGHRPESAVGEKKLEDSAMKNWLLAGIVPYSRFGTKDLAPDPGPGRHLADVEVTTEFDWLDTVIWVVPGFFYGYYLWAPRHVGVKAVVVKDDAKPVAARP